MAKRAQDFGHRRERQVKALLEEEGWFVIRAPGSLGTCDLAALKLWSTPMLIEVKATARGPVHGFGPADRGALLEAAEKAGAQPLLAYWPANTTLSWIPAEDWPA